MRDGYTLSNGTLTDLEGDLVAEVAGVLEFYGCDMGPLGEDVAAHAILAARAWRERKAAEDCRHAAAHERQRRETAALLDLREARRRVAARVATP